MGEREGESDRKQLRQRSVHDGCPPSPTPTPPSELPADLLLQTEGGYSPVGGGEAAINVCNNMSSKKIPVEEKTADNGWLQLFNNFYLHTCLTLIRRPIPSSLVSSSSYMWLLYVICIWGCFHRYLDARTAVTRYLLFPHPQGFFWTHIIIHISCCLPPHWIVKPLLWEGNSVRQNGSVSQLKWVNKKHQHSKLGVPSCKTPKVLHIR